MSLRLSRIICSLAGLYAPFAVGQTSVTIYSSAQPGTLSSSTFQSGGEGFSVPGYGMVRQDREVSLTAGRTVIRVSDVPALIDPTTVAFESLLDRTGTRVVEQSFEFDLTSTNKLLQKYLDREVILASFR